MSEIIIGKICMYKFSRSQDYLTFNVGCDLFPNQDNSYLKWNVNYDFEIMYIDNI